MHTAQVSPNTSQPLSASTTMPPLAHALVIEAHDALISAVQSYLPETDIAQITDACLFANYAHRFDVRKSGEPYITHPIAVAEILAQFHMDADTIIAAILHDTIEDTEVSKDDIIKRYGSTIAQLVDGVTKLKISQNKAENKAATFSKILTATLDDSRVIIIKLADRLHNMSTMQAVRPEKRMSTAQETLDFYLPFARIMGLNALANDLELLCLQNLDPEQFDYFQHQLNQRQLTRQHRAEQIQTYFYRKINELKLTGHVSITDNRAQLFREFFKNKTELNSLLNNYHLTVVLDQVSSCDALVDYLKQRYRVTNDAIQDNIRKPYPGGYQALHIDYSYDNEHIRLTIQTDAMQRAAKLGAMLGEDAPEESRSVLQASLTNLHELVDQQCAINTTAALMDYLHHDKVLVYTCHGDLKELPLGSTVLDFAYSADEFLGHHAIGALVDGKPAKLTTKLKTGNSIKIQVDPLSSPNAEWLSFLVTTKARESLQNWLSQQGDEEQLMGGKDALNRALKHFDPDLSRLNNIQWQMLFDWQRVSDKNSIYKRIALGRLLPQLIISKLFSDTPEANPINANVNQDTAATQSATILQTTEAAAKENHNVSDSAISEDATVKDTRAVNTHELVLGTSGICLHYGNCCNPILGDVISGHLTHEGLVVHRFRCDEISDALATEPQHIIGLRWNPHFERDLRFSVILRMNCLCDDDAIQRIMLRLHEINAGINDIYNDPAKQATYAYLLVRDRNHLAEVVRELRAMLGYPSVKRLYQLD